MTFFESIHVSLFFLLVVVGLWFSNFKFFIIFFNVQTFNNKKVERNEKTPMLWHFFTYICAWTRPNKIWKKWKRRNNWCNLILCFLWCLCCNILVYVGVKSGKRKGEIFSEHTRTHTAMYKQEKLCVCENWIE